MMSAVRQKLLVDLLPPSVVLQGDEAVEITGISVDSRKVGEGDLFVAKTGFNQQGSQYISEARERGASAVVTDDAQLEWQLGDLPTAYISNLEEAASDIAASFYDRPSESLSVTGITGTNGKTSCCVWYAWMSNQLGVSCGQIGTLGAGISAAKKGEYLASTLEATGFTTPEAVAVQTILADVRDAGAAAVVMEVSSHGLDQGRVAAVEFEAAIFTNFTQDHLDYHGDMDGYFAAKASLFQRPELKRVVLNRDDATFDRLSAMLPGETALFSYSLSQSIADLYFESIAWEEVGARVRLSGRWGSANLLIPVVGDYNLANVLAVVAALLSAGFEFADIVKALESLPAVPGRMQLLSYSDAPRVVVDYAHTPDAVVNAVKAVRRQVSGELVVVLGCGGDRDREKRPLMGAAATEHADRCWFTSDNPRFENPSAIISEMLLGADASVVRREIDRGEAIKQAISSVAKNDVVLILGKGHEEYQEVDGVRRPFSDVSQADLALRIYREARGNS